MEHASAKFYDDIHNTLKVPCQKFTMISFASSIMKNIVVCPVLSGFAAKLIGSIALGSASIACYLLNSMGLILQ